MDDRGVITDGSRSIAASAIEVGDDLFINGTLGSPFVAKYVSANIGRIDGVIREIDATGMLIEVRLRWGGSVLQRIDFSPYIEYGSADGSVKLTRADLVVGRAIGRRHLWATRGTIASDAYLVRTVQRRGVGLGAIKVEEPRERPLSSVRLWGRVAIPAGSAYLQVPAEELVAPRPAVVREAGARVSEEERLLVVEAESVNRTPTASCSRVRSMALSSWQQLLGRKP